MPAVYRSPGVYREDIFLKPETALPTGVPGFIGFSETVVKLDGLPVGVMIPSEFDDRLRFDAGRKQLIFHGVMTADEKERLLRLAEELAFNTAIHSLYSLTQRVAVPNTPIVLRRKEEFDQWFTRIGCKYLAAAVDGFFDNGGIRCYVVRADSRRSDLDAALLAGLNALETVEDLDLIAIPDVMTLQEIGQINELKLDIDAIRRVQQGMLLHCHKQRTRFALLDSCPGFTWAEVKEQQLDPLFFNQREPISAAFYYPWIRLNNGDLVPPSGHVAGVYARRDAQAGVFKAPANEALVGVLDLERPITNEEQDQLNPAGINCLRAFPGRGIRVWGARTLSRDPLWRYVNVRRLFITLQRWLDRNMVWAAFEPNTPRLWVRIQRELSDYLTSLWKAGALMGTVPEQAFFVKCDGETNPVEKREQGQVATEIGLAPMVPSEFIVVRIIHRDNGIVVT